MRRVGEYIKEIIKGYEILRLGAEVEEVVRECMGEEKGSIAEVRTEGNTVKIYLTPDADVERIQFEYKERLLKNIKMRAGLNVHDVRFIKRRKAYGR